MSQNLYSDSILGTGGLRWYINLSPIHRTTQRSVQDRRFSLFRIAGRTPTRHSFLIALRRSKRALEPPATDVAAPSMHHRPVHPWPVPAPLAGQAQTPRTPDRTVVLGRHNPFMKNRTPVRLRLNRLDHLCTSGAFPTDSGKSRDGIGIIPTPQAKKGGVPGVGRPLSCVRRRGERRRRSRPCPGEGRGRVVLRCRCCCRGQRRGWRCRGGVSSRT